MLTWEFHSVSCVHWRAVMRITNSRSLGGSTVLNCRYSPSISAGVMTSGLRSSAKKGPRMGGAPRFEANCSNAFFWASLNLSGGISFRWRFAEHAAAIGQNNVLGAGHFRAVLGGIPIHRDLISYF